MEHIFNKGIFGNVIICHTTLFIVLFITGIASEPLWIWTKGCRVQTNSTDFLNQTENTPYTCFHACGKNTSTVALQGYRCSCNPEPTGKRPASFCKPCDGNKMAACGHVAEGYWSLYERADIQLLTDHGIDNKTTGCVVYSSKGSFSVENCSTEKRGLCKNVFSNGIICGINSKTWSTNACDNGNYQLVDTFTAVCETYNPYLHKYWIGLFSTDRASSHKVASPTDISPTSASPTDISPTSASPTDISPTSASPTDISPTSASPTDISPPSTSPTDISPTSASPTDISPPSTSPTDISPTSASPTDISPTSASPTDISSTSASPTDISPTSTSPTDISPPSTSPTDISPPSASPTDISPPSTSPTYISLTSTSTYISPTSTFIDESSTYTSINISPSEIPSTPVLHSEPLTPFKPTTLKVVPLLSSTGRLHVIHTSVPHTPTDTSVKISPSIKTATKPAPTNAPSYDFMTTILRTSETFTRKTYVLQTSQKHFKTLKHKVFGGLSSNDIGSTTPKELMSRSNTVIETPVSLARSESSNKDKMVALTVVGTLLAIALVVVAMLTVHVRRSMKVIQMQRRMTTMRDCPTMGSEETVFTDRDESERCDDFIGDIPNTFSTARRADLHVQGNQSLFSNRGRTVQENKYVLY